MMPQAVVFKPMGEVPEASEQLAEPLRSHWRTLARAGEGATSVVWKARRSSDDKLVALKVAKATPEAREGIRREGLLLARVARQWGPALVDAGPGFLAVEWTEGAELSTSGVGGDRERRAARVAHAVGRALEELHEAGVRHGDVKPRNVLVSSVRAARDAPDVRAATLIDIGLADDVGQAARGGTPRYAAPELRSGKDVGPAADLWALGILLAEILDPAVGRADDPREAIARWTQRGEVARWVDALVATAPGGRPSAAWVGRQAARWLSLETDEHAVVASRRARVRRSYLATRSAEVASGAIVSARVLGPSRAWLEEAVEWATKLGASDGGRTTIEPLSELQRAQWIVRLVGPSAASWANRTHRDENALAIRVLQLAELGDPFGWTAQDLFAATPATAVWDPGAGEERLARTIRELARPAPSLVAVELAEQRVAQGDAPESLALALAMSLLRAGEVGRAWVALAASDGVEVDAVRADLARRRGDAAEATLAAERALSAADPIVRGQASAVLARLAWDAGDLAKAQARLEGAVGPAAAEMRALVAWRQGTFEAATDGLELELAQPLDADVHARLVATRGLLEGAKGDAFAAVKSFERAVELASRAGARVEEATYLTSEAAAATDVGDTARALGCATRAALLWERLGRPGYAARAWLVRAACFATLGVVHDTDEAAEETRSRAFAVGDSQAAAYARWAQIEVRPVGDAEATRWALEADRLLAQEADDGVRSAARLLVWAPASIDEARIAATDARAAKLAAPIRWEWWGARAAAIVAGRKSRGDEGVLGALLALMDVPAPLSSKGPALDAAVSLATTRGDGDAARRLEVARQAAARALREGAPPAHATSLAGVAWARTSAVPPSDVEFAPAQVSQLESIVRALSAREGLRALLEQVLDTMILWTGVERGLLLLRAPDGRLVPRAARNLARHDLSGEQLALSQTIARRAIEEGDAVVATDAFSTLGDVHASVHALKLRSVLAVPLLARGETLGVVYLDDRGRKGAFGTRELAWVRVVASQAAMAIADARDAVLLRRAVRRAERARYRVEVLLGEKDAELDVTRARLEAVRDGGQTRFDYSDIAGRSEPMRELLRLVDRVTASEVPVLIVGESGTGKELVARAMHSNGPRSKRAFVSENCASVPETLLESTLFGHVRGAFTGASGNRAGLFEVADGGTLFLDEIGEMSLGMQAKLLRVLQDGEVRAVGGERSRKVNVRVIGATHRDLTAMVEAGTFREDLLYRLNVITLRVPPLRERPDDVPPLVQHFIRKHAPDRPVQITRAAMAKLAAFPWPGNVRQLENELRRALVLTEGTIDVLELSADVVRGGPSAARGTGLALRERVDALEKELVLEALARNRGNQTRAAKQLGLSRFGLQKMMKRLGIRPTL